MPVLVSPVNCLYACSCVSSELSLCLFHVSAVSLEALAANYLLERDEGCAACHKYQQMKDTSNVKVVELSQQVTQLQRELSRIKSESVTMTT